MDKLEKDLENLRLLASGPINDSMIYWLREYLRGHNHQPRIEPPHDPDGSPGIYLCELLRESIKSNKSIGRIISQNFADASLILFRSMLEGGYKIEAMDGDFIVDLCFILWEFAAFYPSGAIKILCSVKDDRRFRINYSRGPVRQQIYRALNCQLIASHNPSQFNWVLPTLEGDMNNVADCDSAFYTMCLIDPEIAIKRFKEVVELQLASGQHPDHIFDDLAQLLHENKELWKALLQEALKFPDRTIHDKLEECRVWQEKWESLCKNKDTV